MSDTDLQTPILPEGEGEEGERGRGGGGGGRGRGGRGGGERGGGRGVGHAVIGTYQSSLNHCRKPQTNQKTAEETIKLSS